MVVVLLATYVIGTFVQVWHASHQDDARRAQAIIVLGAAQFNGRPSAVLAARLDHAADLYKQGLAPLVVVTGGNQPGDVFTEAEVSANYLSQHGVPGNAIERETTSKNSYDELAATARFLKPKGITNVVLVSDPFHAFRINAIAHAVGFDASVSPTPTSPVHGIDNAEALMRETVAVSAGRVVGFDRLD
ncbi:MAG TPA: YdcF family protein, partial [Acidimicrobiales bacterium]|nr:YdcF family protein [Acidimicrobiales bacterium]